MFYALNNAKQFSSIFSLDKQTNILKALTKKGTHLGHKKYTSKSKTRNNQQPQPHSNYLDDNYSRKSIKEGGISLNIILKKPSRL